MLLKKLNSLANNLPNFLDDTSKVNESIVSINKRITALEASNIPDNKNLRIGKLEEAMETLSLTFSSLKFKREKAFVGKEQKFMYVPKVSKPKPIMCLKLIKPLVKLRVIYMLNHLRGYLRLLL